MAGEFSLTNFALQPGSADTLVELVNTVPPAGHMLEITSVEFFIWNIDSRGVGIKASDEWLVSLPPTTNFHGVFKITNDGVAPVNAEVDQVGPPMPAPMQYADGFILLNRNVLTNSFVVQPSKILKVTFTTGLSAVPHQVGTSGNAVGCTVRGRVR